jgi:hypothetical protein
MYRTHQACPAPRAAALYVHPFILAESGQRQLFLPIDDNYTYPWFSLPLGE